MRKQFPSEASKLHAKNIRQKRSAKSERERGIERVVEREIETDRERDKLKLN